MAKKIEWKVTLCVWNGADIVHTYTDHSEARKEYEYALRQTCWRQVHISGPGYSFYKG